MTEAQYKEALKRSEYLIDKEESESGLEPKLENELDQLIVVIDEHEHDLNLYGGAT